MAEKINDVVIDIITGALPIREVPRFLAWVVGRAFWPLIALVFCAGLIYAVLR